MNHWYISDTHFGHENIWKTFKRADGITPVRPFISTLEVDETLITNWNAVVKPEDHISHLGDITMRRGGVTQQGWLIKLIARLNGHKRLYLGNHDHFPVECYLKAGFEKIYATWRTEDGLLFSHYPIHPQSLGNVKANIHGHIHDKPNYPPHVWKRDNGEVMVQPYVNISCEQTGYAPIHLDEVLQRIRVAKETYVHLQ